MAVSALLAQGLRYLDLGQAAAEGDIDGGGHRRHDSGGARRRCSWEKAANLFNGKYWDGETGGRDGAGVEADAAQLFRGQWQARWSLLEGRGCP